MPRHINESDLEAARKAIQQCDGSVNAACKLLGISRSTLRYRAGFLKKQVKAVALPPQIKEKTNHSLSTARFVITSAQNATPIHKEFFGSLLTYCRETGSQLMVIPYRYKNPTSIFTTDEKDLEYWAPEVAPYLVNTRIKLNSGLMVLGDIKTQPTAVNPLSGFETITGSCSAIIGHPKLDLTTIATPQRKLPKILTTTGACTKADYSDTKAGVKGAHHHTYGACVVEIDGDVFHMRQINAVENGSFIDLEHEYTGKGRKLAPPAAALVMGDTHAEVRDPQAMSATFYGPGSIVHTLRPKFLIWHDLIDFTARNHHNIKDPFFRYARHHAVERRHDNVERELREAFGFIDSVTPEFSRNIIVAANHNEALDRWIRESDPRHDPENALFHAQTTAAMLESAHVTDTGVSVVAPLEYWGKKWMKTAKRTRFLSRGESFMVHNIELGMHGDKGPNGARGSRNAFTKIGCKSVIGHSHSPGITAGVYQVGTNSRLDLSYAAGSPSSWLHTDCVIYANGKRSLINIIGGKWRATP
jgi:hypothetical protein